MSNVALVRCQDYQEPDLGRALDRALELAGGLAAYVSPGQSVLIKPNMLSACTPDERVTTDPALVHAVGQRVLEAGGRPMIGDSPAIDGFKRVAAKSGIGQVADELGIPLVELDNPRRVTLPEEATYRSLEISSRALDAEAVINLPKLKTHGQMLMTLGVKNLFGTIVAQRKGEWHYMVGMNRTIFASLLLDIYQAVSPALTILDGVWGMEGEGPANGQPRHFGLLAVSADALALDLVICRMLGVPLRRLPLYRAARDRGLAAALREDEVQLLGDDPASLNLSPIQLPDLDSMDVLPGPLSWFTRHFLVSKPVQNPSLCEACGKCAKICPAQALVLRKKEASFNYDNCIRCYCCQEVCPAGAISFKTGLLVKLLNRLGR
jgi:uncharacterized protein (DUF362 family)/Pyruvate/2-oxoacid:ferredoxin oxidoreductase delta subunit